jgi:ATP-binding cassette subfamily G (WHITE) protein 2 (SNQ2)
MWDADHRSAGTLLVTVHQPSALLFEQFDQLLLLAKGGRTVYNGELGKHAATMKAYFKKHGAEIRDEENSAEAMIDIVSGARSKGHDWAQVWLDSDEYKDISATQTKLVTARAWSSIIRTPEYVLGRIGLVIGTGLITGLTFERAVFHNDYASVQNRLLATFQAMFVAPGLFVSNVDLCNSDDD